MICKRLASALLACMLLLSCSLVPITAMDAPASQIIMPRAAGRLDHTLSPGITLIGEKFSLDSGDKITYDCTYTPKSASVDSSSAVWYRYVDCQRSIQYPAGC